MSGTLMQQSAKYVSKCVFRCNFSFRHRSVITNMHFSLSFAVFLPFLALSVHTTFESFLADTFSLPRMTYDPVSNTVCYAHSLSNECASRQEIKWVTGTDAPEDLHTWAPTSEADCAGLLDLEAPYLDWVVTEVFGAGDYHPSTATSQQADIPWALRYLALHYSYFNLYHWSQWTAVLKAVDWSTVSCKTDVSPMTMTSTLGTVDVPQAIENECDSGSKVCDILCSFSP